MRLTEISIRALKSPEKGQVTHYDDSLPGFGVRVSQGGSKTFIVVYGPTRRRMTIGRFPLVSLSDARTEARRVMAEATLGKHRPKSVTFDSAKDEFLENSKRQNRHSTYRNYVRLLRHFAFGKTKLGDIAKQDVKRKLDRLIDRPAEHQHALVAIKGFFRFAVREGYLDYNPAEGLRAHQRSTARDRVLSPVELKAVLAASQGAAHPFGPIVELLALTGQRRGEIAALEWDWVDRTNRTITLPASLTKNKREHVFPYGDIIQAVLECLPRIDDSPYLFPASKHRWKDKEPTIFDSWSKSKALFDKLLPDLEPWTLHDLRRTFATTMASLSVPQIVVEKLLNHVSGGTQSPIAQVYNRHSYLEEMREAIKTYEVYLADLLKE
ncbi:MAG: tyrosine-type recombinase/integrase [Rhizobiaceae bacterium]|nr:tyrosine-type recombinase/integrase [Rhizobiaceae bacterium]